MARPALSPKQFAEARDSLLAVALRLYEERGVDGMSFRAIAAEHGCSASMPYLYFESKAALVDHLRIRAYDWLRDQLARASATAVNPFEALRNIAVAYVRAGLERPRMYELLYSQDGAMAETDSRLLEAKRAALGVCIDAIRRITEHSDGAMAEDPETAAHLFWIAAHGLVSLDHGGFLVVGRSLDDLLPGLFASLVRGMGDGDFAAVFSNLEINKE